jgi:ATP-binding cassette, subfamily F, member 3
MSQLSISGISISYGGQLVLEGASLQLQPGEKAGLIGPNGSGKTTLLRIIAGELEPDSGSVHRARGSAVGYLPQELELEQEGTLREQLEKPLRALFLLKREIADLEQQMADSSKETGQLDLLLGRYSEASARFETMGGYSAESRIQMVALGLGFKLSDLDRDLRRFSGGEKTRARLAALLLQQPDLLLLDEPTNFLDLEGVEWLERYLRELSRSLIVVSHDRFFLDRVVGRIFSLQGRSVKSYPGNYSTYLVRREQEREEAERAYRSRQALLEREQRLIRESTIDERSKRQARSRQKRLDKLETVKRLEESKTFNLDFDYTGRSGRQVAIIDGVHKSFGARVLFKGLTFEINWGDRVALVGPNGAGKSTLLRLIAGEEKPDSGSIRLGAAVRVTYFSQEQEQLQPDRTLLDEITATSELDLKQARNHLGGYLFRGDDVFKKVKDLSGGEKSRLALARLALSSGNCLLMDEPTSHLDLPAVEELEKALQGYPGTLIVVSHDRYFLQNLANRVLELGRGGLKIFNGDFRYYLEQRSGPVGFPDQPGGEQESRETLKHRRRQEHTRRQEQQRRERRLQDEQAQLEESIAAVEAAMARLEKTLANPDHYGDYTRLIELNHQLENEKEKLAGFFKRWEEICLQLEQIAGQE